MKRYGPIPLEEILAARERIKYAAIKTPLVKLNLDDAPAEIYLKLENLQPVGSFKITRSILFATRTTAFW